MDELSMQKQKRKSRNLNHAFSHQITFRTKVKYRKGKISFSKANIKSLINREQWFIFAH